jgi:chemotaxis protein MotB
MKGKGFKLRRRKKEEDHVDESWLIPYADVLTLLLALFIVLFAASEIDAQKFKQIADSFNSELQGGKDILDHEAAVETVIPLELLKEEEAKNSDISMEQDFKELSELQEKIEDYIEEKELSPRLQTTPTNKGLVLKITEGILFPPGGASITTEPRKVAQEISNLLVTDLPREILIEGHTDNVPTHSVEFPTNWELSTTRAINFMKVLLENKDLKPQNFSATGYSEYRPIATNNTAKGRAENRRVEVLILPYQEPN